MTMIGSVWYTLEDFHRCHPFQQSYRKLNKKLMTINCPLFKGNCIEDLYLGKTFYIHLFFIYSKTI